MASAVDIAIDALIERLISASSKIASDGADLIKTKAKRNILSNFQQNTGALFESVLITGPEQTGVGEFTALIGPTVNYGRIRELGGFIPGGATPKPKPPGSGKGSSWLSWVDYGGARHYAKLVYQVGNPYLYPASMDSEDEIQQIAIERWGDAIKVLDGT